QGGIIHLQNAFTLFDRRAIFDDPLDGRSDRTAFFLGFYTANNLTYCSRLHYAALDHGYREIAAPCLLKLLFNIAQLLAQPQPFCGLSLAELFESALHCRRLPALGIIIRGKSRTSCHGGSAEEKCTDKRGANMTSHRLLPPVKE